RDPHADPRRHWPPSCGPNAERPERTAGSGSFGAVDARRRVAVRRYTNYRLQSDHGQKLVLAKYFHPQLSRLLQFRAGCLARDEIAGLRRNRSAGLAPFTLDQLVDLVAGE